MSLVRAPSIAEILSCTRILSAAEILALDATGISVTPSPGANQLLWPISFNIMYNFATFEFGPTANYNVEYAGSGFGALPNDLGSFTGLGVSRIAMGSSSQLLATASTISSLQGLPLNFRLSSGTTAGGGISAASPTAGGTGYAIGDTGSITTGNGDATYRVLTVSGLGAVLTFAITYPGTAYAVGAGQATATGGAQPGVGINFTVDVTAINNGDGTIKVTTLYQVMDVP